jgi:hypothetical protein
MLRRHFQLALILIHIFAGSVAYAALSGNTIYEINASATASNVNGGGFNPANANMLTDLATTDGTSATPTVTSATYTFVAGDVGNWVYVKSGTNWNPGWYKISSVATGAATLNAAVGAAVVKDATVGWPNPKFKANTVQGIATQDTPGGNGTFTIDYSQATAATVTKSDGTTSASTTYTSATAGFTPVMVGNFLHQTAGTGATAGWYEIVSYTNSTTIVLDRASGTTSNGTFYIGGAMSLNSTLDNAFFATAVGSSGTEATRFFIKAGSYALGQNVTSTGVNGTNRFNITVEGYNTIRGDNPTGSSRPTISSTTQVWTLGTSWALHNIIVSTNNASNTVMAGGENAFYNSKFINTAAGGTSALNMSAAGGICSFCEAVAPRGYGILVQSGPNVIFGSYIHDSSSGVRWGGTGTAGFLIANSIIADNYTVAVDNTQSTNDLMIVNSTLYGAENKLGTGVLEASGSIHTRVFNTIFYGFTTGFNHPTTTIGAGVDDYNNFYNNTTDVVNWVKGATTIALDPAFTDTAQITGTGATSSTNVLTAGSGTPFGGVEDGVDYVYLSAGTGTGISLTKYLITSHTTTTLTLERNITTSGSGSAIAWQITTGHDFSVGANMKGVGFPGAFNGTGASGTTGYMDIGAVQRAEPAASTPGLQGFSYSQ